MKAVIAEQLMVLACRLFRGDPDWAHAIRAEFEEATIDGQSLTFSLGAVSAGMKRQFQSPEALACAFAIFVILPWGVFHIACAVSGARLMTTGQDAHMQTLAAGGETGQALASAYFAATPLLTALISALGLGHLGMALAVWVGRWREVGVTWLLTAMVAALILVTISPLDPTRFGLGLQIAALGLELLILPLLAADQARHSASSWKG